MTKRQPAKEDVFRRKKQQAIPLTGGGHKKEQAKFTPFSNLSKTGIIGAVEGEEEGSARSRQAESQRDTLAPSSQQVYEIPIDRVLDSPYQMRDEKANWTEKQLAEFAKLRTYIREEGLHEIFFVAPHPDPQMKDCYLLAYGGHNRRDAARIEGYRTLPCIIVSYDREKISYGTTQENEVRIPLTLEERGRHYRRLMQDHQLSQEKLAQRLDLTRDTIKNCLMIATCAADIRELVRNLEEGSGIRIARSLKRLDALAGMMQNEEAPALARAPLIAGYQAKTMKTDVVEAAIESILALAQHAPDLSVQEILQRLFYPATEEEQAQGEHLLAEHADGEGNTQAPLKQEPAALSQGKSDLHEQSADPLASSGLADPEQTERLKQLMKAQRSLNSYRKLVSGKARTYQERDLLARMKVLLDEISH